MNYYPSSKIANGYPRKQSGATKLTEEEQEDHVRDERLHALLFCVDCVHYLPVFIVYYNSYKLFRCNVYAKLPKY